MIRERRLIWEVISVVLIVMLSTIDPQAKGPAYELFSSIRRTAVGSVLKNWTHFSPFFGWLMLPHTKATSFAHSGPRNIQPLIERCVND